MQQFSQWLQAAGLKLLSPLLTLVMGILAVRIIMGILAKALKRSKLEKAAHSLIKSVVRVVLYGLLALICASSLGLDVTGVVALASVVSLALSLALQDSLTNVIGGFTLLYTKPFHSGDYVEIAGQFGAIDEIGIAYTKLLTPDNKLISFPNSAVVAAQIINYTVTGKRRVALDVTIAYATEGKRVFDVLYEVAQVPYAMADPAPFACILGYGPDGIQYSLRIWTKSEDYWDAWFLLNRRLQEIMAREGLEIIHPIMNVRMES